MPRSFSLKSASVSLGGRLLLDTLDISVAAGETVIITGRTGVGKSVLLEACAGIRPLSSGVLAWDGVNYATMNRSRIMNARQHLGYLFQSHALIQNYPLYENVALPLRYHSDMTEPDVRSRVREVLGKFGLLECLGFFPEALSAGQARCAALARALVCKPELLLLDDPSGDVDRITAELIVRTIMHERLERPLTLCMVSHDAFLANAMESRVMVLDKGKLISFANFQDDAHTFLHEDNSLMSISTKRGVA